MNRVSRVNLTKSAQAALGRVASLSGSQQGDLGIQLGVNSIAEPKQPSFDAKIDQFLANTQIKSEFRFF